MRTGIITDAFADSIGIQKYTDELTRGLVSDDRIESLCVVHSRPNGVAGEGKVKDVQIRMPDIPFQIELRQLLVLPRVLARLDLELLHDTYHFGPYAFGNSGYKKVLTVHDINPFVLAKQEPEYRKHLYSYYITWLKYRQIFSRIIRNADGIIAVSEYTKQDLIKHFGIDPDKVSVVHQGVDNSRFRLVDREVVAREKQKFFKDDPLLIVGFDSPRAIDNVESLIHAFRHLRPRSRNVKLLLIGKPNASHVELVRSMGLENDVVFTGYVPDEELPVLLNTADVFAHLSLYEGFGLPPLEAMACGAPVAVSNATSLPEVVGDAGIVIDKNEPGHIAGVLGDLLSDERHRDDLRTCGLRRSKEFSWDNTVRSTIKVYESLI